MSFTKESDVKQKTENPYSDSVTDMPKRNWWTWGYEAEAGISALEGPETFGYAPGTPKFIAWNEGIAAAKADKAANASVLDNLTDKEAADYIQEVARDAEVVDLTDTVNATYSEDGVTIEAAPGTLAATLAERGSRYGEFKDHAVYADKIVDVMQSSPNWKTMAPDQRESFRIIANKIARILNGDPDYSDSWHDIAGYATLVDKRLKGEGK